MFARHSQKEISMSSLIAVASRRTGFLAVLATMVAAATPLSNLHSTEPSGSAANVPGNMPATSGPASAATAPSNSGKPAERLREGTRLTDIKGAFVSIGADSVTFSPKGGKDSYRVLENLALQRVSQQLDENRGHRQWVVSGLITEFRGSNYLLVTKAVVQLQDGDSVANQ
jgi:hypothetical protein